MPAKSKAQQKAAGAALAAKRGEKSKSSLKGPSRSMARSMSESKLKDMAKGSTIAVVKRTTARSELNSSPMWSFSNSSSKLQAHMRRVPRVVATWGAVRQHKHTVSGPLRLWMTIGIRSG